MHGKYGEDGCIQGILEVLKIPYTGCGVMSSAICMNKEYTKRILQTADLPLIKSVYLLPNENPVEKVHNLEYPLMVKPARYSIYNCKITKFYFRRFVISVKE